jgi:hypothetical protein
MTWTILNEGGSKAIEFTAMFTLDVRDNGLAVSTPIEEGSFANYNKVQSPTEIRVTLGIEGDNYLLDGALETTKELQRGTDLVNLATPSAYYESLTIESHSYRFDRSRGFLTVDLTLVEVRQVQTQVGTTDYAPEKVKNPTSASTQNTGKTQAGEPSKETKKSVLKDILG